MYSDLPQKTVLWRMLLLVFGLSAMVARAEVVVIVHPSNDAVVDKATLKKIFMGRTKTFPDGSSARPVDLEGGETRKAFLAQYLQKNQGSLDSYWARMIFTGGGTPPKAYATEDDVRTLVANNRDAIGYIDSSRVDDSVKVLQIR